jgi:hypothetical protein
MVVGRRVQVAGCQVQVVVCLVHDAVCVVGWSFAWQMVAVCLIQGVDLFGTVHGTPVCSEQGGTVVWLISVDWIISVD